MTLNQRVPTDAIGGMAQWSRGVGRSQFFTRGHRLAPGGRRQRGGWPRRRHRHAGHAAPRLGRHAAQPRRSSCRTCWTPATGLMVTLSARVDRWRNYDGHNLENSVPSGTPTAEQRADAAGSRRHRRQPARRGALSPDRAGQRVGRSRLGLPRADAQRAVSPVPRRHGADARQQPARARAPGRRRRRASASSRCATSRGGRTWFDNRVKDPVSNVTLATVGANVTQQRQNLGRTRISGVQTDVEYRLGVGLDGRRRLSLQPRARHRVRRQSRPGRQVRCRRCRGTAARSQIEYTNPRYVNVAFGLQALGDQFDDDQNTPSRVLPGYAVLSLSASRRVSRNLEVFAGVQNLSDREYRRRHAADDDRNAAAGQRRRAGALRAPYPAGEVRRGEG